MYSVKLMVIDHGIMSDYIIINNNILVNIMLSLD